MHHTPLSDDNPYQHYVVLKIIEGDERSRAVNKSIKHLLYFPPFNLIKLYKLEVLELDTAVLDGGDVTINKVDYSQIKGKVAKISEQRVMLDLNWGVKEVEYECLSNN